MSLNSYFQIKDHNSTITREITGGLTTYLALSYIIFVQPAILANCGMDKSAVLFATCLCSALACFIMGLWAKLPFALAPAMGHNIFFAFTVCGPTAFGFSWQEALAANLIAGALFLLVSLLGLRNIIMNAIPESLKFAIAAGIGLFISLLGLEWAGIVVASPATYVTLGKLIHPVPLLSIFGLLVIGVLLALRFRAAILVGMILTALAGYFATQHLGADWSFKLVQYSTNPEFPHVAATAGKVFTQGLPSLFSHNLQTVALIVFIFLLLDVFDTIGTLVGLGARAGLMQNGQLPRAQQALLADACGTIAGSIMGTSTITSYVESSAGIAAGARTGLASIVTGILLLASIAAYPFIETFGAAIPIPAADLHLNAAAAPDADISCYPIIAPVLIIIGCYMLSVIRHIDWDDFSEALPAFLTIVIMQCSMSITDGIIWGFTSYAAIKILTLKPHKCPLTVYLCAILFVLYYIFGR